MTVITGKENIELHHLLGLKYALRLEILGMKHSRGSVYAKIKRKFNLKGNKQKVYDKFCELIINRDTSITTEVKQMNKLESVGCAISADGTTYVLNDDGTADKFSDVHLDDCCVEWYDSLSTEDRQTVLEIRWNSPKKQDK